MLAGKNGTIKELQYELARVTKAHNDVIRTYEARLEELGVPTATMGFRPRQLATVTATGAAGLVTAT